MLRRARALGLPLAITFGATAAMLLLGRTMTAAQSGPSPAPSTMVTTLPLTTPTAEQESGRRLYLRDCAWCHGNAGEGTALGPSLAGVGAASADFMLTTGRMPIAAPSKQPPRRETPYRRADIQAITAYIASLGAGPLIPAVDPARGTLGEGADLYEENCAACHSSTGIGGALTNGLEAPSVLSSSPVQVVEALRLGGAGLRSGNMPKFGPEVMDDHQADSIARYVGYLQRPDDRGGAPLGRIGPVVEGFIAWALVLLALILVIRWIGTKNPLAELEEKLEEEDG